MPKSVNGQASWVESLRDKYLHRDKLINELRHIHAEISSLELVMLMQQLPIGEDNERTTREPQSD